MEVYGDIMSEGSITTPPEPPPLNVLQLDSQASDRTESQREGVRDEQGPLDVTADCNVTVATTLLR